MTKKVIILDRDGVINQDSDEFIKSPEEWQPIEGSLQAIAQLNNAGYKVAVATNQSGVARGLFDINVLEAVHQKMHNMLADYGGHIDGVYFCPHGPDDKCKCRKPLPGLLYEIASKLKIELKDVPVIGDSFRDLQAAMAAGAEPILVKTGKGLKTLKEPKLQSNIKVYNDLADFTHHFLVSSKK